MCSVFSSWERQRGHREGPSHPFFWRLAPVRILSCRAVQVKKSILGRLFTAQMLFQRSRLSWFSMSMRRWYPAVVEYLPDLFPHPLESLTELEVGDLPFNIWRSCLLASIIWRGQGISQSFQEPSWFHTEMSQMVLMFRLIIWNLSSSNS